MSNWHDKSCSPAHQTTTPEGKKGTRGGAVTNATRGVTNPSFKGAHVGGVTSTLIQELHVLIILFAKNINMTKMKLSKIY